MEEIEKLKEDYAEMKKIFKEIEDNGKSITKFIDKLFLTCAHCSQYSMCNNGTQI
jgi:ferritin